MNRNKDSDSYIKYISVIDLIINEYYGVASPLHTVK